jgi:membrane protease YdiL (CAAX protease family)
VFRGVLFRGLRARSGFWVAALVSATLFTIAHLGEGGGWLASAVIVTGIMPLGVAFAALVERRGTLVVSIVAHATYNAIGVAVLILTAGQI